MSDYSYYVLCEACHHSLDPVNEVIWRTGRCHFCWSPKEHYDKFRGWCLDAFFDTLRPGRDFARKTAREVAYMLRKALKENPKISEKVVIEALENAYTQGAEQKRFLGFVRKVKEMM